MKRSYRVVETVVVRRTYNVDACSRSEALERATDEHAYPGIAPGIGTLDAHYHDIHVIRVDGREIGLDAWQAQDAVCTAWLKKLREATSRKAHCA